MRALILGAGGQVGRALVASAAPEDKFDALTRLQADLTDDDALLSVVESSKPDILLNMAAYTKVDLAESELELADRVNRRAPQMLARMCKKLGVRFVHVSTDFVFDGTSSVPYRPSDETNPINVYGRTKQAGEQSVLAANEDALIVRSSWIYDAGPTNFVATIMRLSQERPSLTIVEDQIGSPTSAASLARGLWALARSGVCGIYHYRDSGVASWYDFAVSVVELGCDVGLISQKPDILPIPSSSYPTPARRPAYSVLDISATIEVLGYTPPHWRSSLREVMKERADAQ